MIDVADSNAVYYYHYNALGSVVALSDSDGESCQSYEYSAYGQVWAEYSDFIVNPYMFTGRRFDYETGLYYYRARYYNPYIGRFLQTDPIGYGAGINWYAYCGNNPVNRADPAGLDYTFLDMDHDDAVEGRLTWAWVDPYTQLATVINDYEDIDAWCNDASKFLVNGVDRGGWHRETGRRLSGGNDWLFQRLQALVYLGADLGNISRIEGAGTVNIVLTNGTGDNSYYAPTNTLNWDPEFTHLYPDSAYRRHWYRTDPLAMLAHELSHAHDDLVVSPGQPDTMRFDITEVQAVLAENQARYALFKKVPGSQNLWPRPGYTSEHKDISRWAGRAWKKYWDPKGGVNVKY